MKFWSWSYLRKVILLTIFYFGAAKVGILFFSSADMPPLIWPSTGLALAVLLLFGYQLWPGVLLGSLLATSSISSPWTFTLINAIGNLLETLLAVYFLRRVGIDLALTRARDIIQLTLWGAGLSPMLGTAISVAGLCFAGLATWSAYSSIWWAWWLAHATSVMIVTPFLLVVVQWARKQVVTESFLLPLASSLLGIALILSLVIWRSEEQYLRIKLHNDAREMVREIDLVIEKNAQYLFAIDGLYAASEEVERHEYSAFVSQLLNHMTMAQAVAWIPHVSQDEQIAYEQAAQRDGFPDFQFTEQDTNDQFISATHHAEYFPVYFLEPYTGNETVLGFDIGSDPIQLEAISQARDTGQPVAALTTWTQGSELQKRLSIFLPLYDNNATVNSIETRHTNLRGFISGIFNINTIVVEALSTLQPQDVEVYLFDITSEDNVQFLTFVSCLSDPRTLVDNSELTPDELQTGLHYTSTFDVNGRTWLAVALPCSRYLSEGHSWGAWITLVIGFFLSVIILVYVEMRHQTHLKIEFQKNLLECQLEASLDGILIVSEEREWLYYNQRFVEMWDIPSAVLAERAEEATLTYIIPLLAEPETGLAFLNYLRNHLTETSRKEIALKDGRVFEHYSAPVISAEGKYHGYLWSYRDITWRKQLQAQLLQAQKMDAMGRLAGGIAHDFNNILLPITLYTEMAMMKLSSDSKLYADLQVIQESVIRATGLTRQILAFSRKQVLKMRVLDLNAIVTELEKMLLHLIREDIQVQTILDPMLNPIYADKGQIEQVLMNLVINARDAMPTGGRLTIETANVYLDESYINTHADMLTVGTFVMLSVHDTGHGMDTDTQQQIFDPFFTTKEMGKGTGLGLATVFGIIKQHKGNIWVYSEPGEGTIFKIYLPCAEDVEQEPEVTPQESRSILGTETVLVVEDEEVARQLICETLSVHGYKVLEAQDTNHALQIAVSHRKNLRLLLTDVIMPEMNGRELYEKVATIQPDVSVLYMSGYTDNIIVHQGILDNEVNLLQKPFTVSKLMQKVREVLD